MTDSKTPEIGSGKAQDDKLPKINHIDPQSFWQAYKIIDDWYHKNTRHHLVDIDSSAKEMINEVVAWSDRRVEKAVKRAELKARIDENEKWLQLHGATIHDCGRRVDNVIHHDTIHNRLAQLQSQQPSEKK